jgi:hypothetical protein
MVILIGAVGLAAPAHAAGITVVLTPMSSAVRPQGSPFSFTATIHNETDQPQLVDVAFAVGAEDSEDPVFFTSIHHSVPAGGESSAALSATTSQWFPDTGRFEITTSSPNTEVGVASLGFKVTSAPVRVPHFQDVTAGAGLTTEMPRKYTCGRWAGGAAWADIDGDGDLDLYVPRQGPGARLWINDGTGDFSDEATIRGVDDGTDIGLSAVFADYDNDGDADLYVGNLGPNRFFQNDGTGHFTDVTGAAGVAGDGDSSSASWGDYDRDGYIDLYVANHTRCTTKEPALDVDKLYHNNGDGTFTDQTALLEKDPSRTDDGATTGAGFQGTWFDYDRDGDLDLLLANDFFGPNADKNHLWRNDGPAVDGTWIFTDVSVESGMALKMNAMGVGVSDYDQDGDLDVGLSNIEDNRLMRNNGNGTFLNVADNARVARPDQRIAEHSVTWGMNFADFNLDTWEDIYTGAGSLKFENEGQPNELFVNGGHGKFFDLSAPSGADFDGVTRGTAFADYDRDGRMDIYIVNHEATSMLYRNVTSKRDRHWLEIDTVGTVSNRDGCGAWLTLTVGRHKLVRQVMCGGVSLASGSDPTVHFGLGRHDLADKLVIKWLSGRKQVLRNLKVDRLRVVTEPSAP